MDRHVLEAMKYQDSFRDTGLREGFCLGCNLELIEVANDDWEFAAGRISTNVVERDGDLFCCGRCLSQYLYDRASDNHQRFLVAMARSAYAWWGAPLRNQTEIRNAGVPELANLRILDDAMHQLGATLFGEEFLEGDDEMPQWAWDAVKDQVRP